jgi:hypothetical protein
MLTVTFAVVQAVTTTFVDVMEKEYTADVAVGDFPMVTVPLTLVADVP